MKKHKEHQTNVLNNFITEINSHLHIKIQVSGAAYPDGDKLPLAEIKYHILHQNRRRIF